VFKLVLRDWHAKTPIRKSSREFLLTAAQVGFGPRQSVL